MILPITKVPTKSLHEPSKEMTKADLDAPEIKELIENMIPSMYAAQGIGLAAPQVGVNVQICVIGKDAIPEDFTIPYGRDDLILVNPSYERTNKRAVLETEGCLSVPGTQGKVKRYKQVHVEALDEKGEPISFDATGYLAHVVQHETDHLGGTLYIDKAESVWNTV